MWLTFDLNPVQWAIGPVSLTRRGNAVVPFVGRNEGLHAFQEAVREQILEQTSGVTLPIMYEVALDMFFWLQVDQYDRATGKRITKNQPDLTNLQKALEDALQPDLIFNDRLTREVHSHLVEVGVDVKDPRIIVRVSQYEGSFDWEKFIPQDVLNRMNRMESLTPDKLREVNTLTDDSGF